MKRHQRLPNGYGSISRLSGKRKNPYCVRPPTKMVNGKRVRQTPICYTDTWYHAFAVLTAWKAGTYTPGMEKEFKISPLDEPNDIIKKIIKDYHIIKRDKSAYSLEYVFNRAIEWHFSHRDLGEDAKQKYRRGYEAASYLHDIPFTEITTADIQKAVDEAANKSQRTWIKQTMSLCYNYGITAGIVTVNLATHVVLQRESVKHGTPFGEDEIQTLWEHRTEDIIYTHALIMIYSGFRNAAYESLEVNLEEGYFKGGVKTKAGKGRIVPIHSGIRKLVEENDVHEIIAKGYYAKFRSAMKKLGMDHSPHDCRHTFSTLCERYGVNENDRKRMLGHTFSDVTNAVYGHRTVEDLRAEIEKICCTSVGSKL